MSGKPLTEASGEEIALATTPFLLGILIASITFVLTNNPEYAVVTATVSSVLTFAVFWPRLVDLGFELEEPRF